MFSIYKVNKVVMLGAFLLSGTCVQAMNIELDIDKLIAQGKAGTAFKENKEETENNTGAALNGADDLPIFSEFFQSCNRISSFFDGGAKEPEKKNSPAPAVPDIDPVDQVPSNHTEALALEVLTLPWFDTDFNSSEELRKTFNLVHSKFKNHVKFHINGQITSFKVDSYGEYSRGVASPPKFLSSLSYERDKTCSYFYGWLEDNVESEKLKSVFLQRTDLSDTVLGRLHKLPCLGLKYECKITDAGVKLLTNLKNLSLEADIRYYQMEFSGEGLKDLTGLETLNLNCINSITDKRLKLLTNLRNLSLKHMDGITDEGLNGLKNLTDLRLTDTNGFTDNEFQKLTNLKNLHLAYVDKITDKGLPIFTNLTHLSLMGCKNITDTGLESLTDLTYLSLSFMKGMTGTGLKNLTNLTELYLEITDASDNEFQNLTNLKKLHLDHSNITDEGLRSLPNLTDLYLRGSDITDEGLRSLPKLIHLSLGMAMKKQNIAGSSFKFLPSLETIKFFNNPKKVCEHEFHTTSDKPFSEDQLNLIIKILDKYRGV